MFLRVRRNVKGISSYTPSTTAAATAAALIVAAAAHAWLRIAAVATIRTRCEHEVTTVALPVAA
jgi:hypothetical protein